MSHRAPHPCVEHGCPHLVIKGSRCLSCERRHHAEDRQQRGSANERGYDAAWQQLSADYRRTHPWCERCARRGVRKRTQLVDHIVALCDGGARLDRSNLMALCRSCHGLKTAADGRARAARGDSISFKAPPAKTAPTQDFSEYASRSRVRAGSVPRGWS